MNSFIKLFPKGANIAVHEQFLKHGFTTISGAGNESSKTFLMADFLRQTKGVDNVLWLCNDDNHRESIVKAIGLWTDWTVYELQYLAINPLKKTQDSRSVKIQSMTWISKWLAKKEKNWILIARIQDLYTLYPSKDEILSKISSYKKGDNIDTHKVFSLWIENGYQVAEESILQKGDYIKKGDTVYIWPVNEDQSYRIDIAFEELESIFVKNGELWEAVDHVDLYPILIKNNNTRLSDYTNETSLIVDDELEYFEEEKSKFLELVDAMPAGIKKMDFRSFMEETAYHHHLHYLSVLKYLNPADFMVDLRDKVSSKWTSFIFTKHLDLFESMLKDKNIAYEITKERKAESEVFVFLVPVDMDSPFPESFQNPNDKVVVLSDRSIGGLDGSESKNPERNKVQMEFLTGLKPTDYVVHNDHGVGQFMGLEKKTVDKVSREYLKIAYAQNDKLFVPIDQADKVSKFIGAGDKAPRLTRLGSAEWSSIQSKVQKETEEIAQELLQLYAERHIAKGFSYAGDDDRMIAFEKAFPYEITPGQLRAILDVKRDMERPQPMDRLVCGDVGFGKTEVSMRAAFKAVCSGKQVAVLAPITILVDQHFKSYVKRMEGNHIRIEMLSRFRSPAEQKEILKKLEKGELDIVIGTHRLLQADIKFKNLGLLIVDEEQRFGVKQKEKLKELRNDVDILTMTATPIPRTMNIALHGLRDISTITTPPPGRLPIVTEVRRFSMALIKTVIEKELDRGGQIYFLHNRVQTIEDMAAKLRSLVPKAKFVVTHGQLKPEELEKRILAFKEGEYDVLVSSTIIENGIDLSNANTLIVNQAEKFGLAQLYQLRGRVGRSKTQAYAYFMYHMNRLPLDAKKRLKAIVEASELGAGFQIAMKDLEIRGAGDVLGANQSGAIHVVGVSHFLRMLNQAVEDLKRGKKGDKQSPMQDVTIELPLPAFIPDEYIVSSKEKISVYQRLAGADTYKYLSELRADIVEDFGRMPEELVNLFRVLELKIYAKEAGITNIKAESGDTPSDRMIILTMSDYVKPENIMSMLTHEANWVISGVKLKIKFHDLGIQWCDALRKSLQILSQYKELDEE